MQPPPLSEMRLDLLTSGAPMVREYLLGGAASQLAFIVGGHVFPALDPGSSHLVNDAYDSEALYVRCLFDGIGG